jgi:hypothetical protein
VTITEATQSRAQSVVTIGRHLVKALAAVAKAGESDRRTVAPRAYLHQELGRISNELEPLCDHLALQADAAARVLEPVGYGDFMNGKYLSDDDQGHLLPAAATGPEAPDLPRAARKALGA